LFQFFALLTYLFSSASAQVPDGPNGLRARIQTACNGVVTCVVNLTASTYEVDAGTQGPISVNSKTLEIRGVSPNQTIIDGDRLGRLFEVGNTELIFTDLTVRDGVATGSGGVVFAVNSTIRFLRSEVVNNEASDNGGAIYATTDSRVFLSGTSLHNNHAGKDGGAVYADSTSRIGVSYGSGSLGIAQNTADQNGGAFYAGGDINLAAVSLGSNRATLDGGAIYAAGEVTWTTGGKVTGSTATTGLGGGIYADVITTSSVSFEANHAGTRGGGLYVARQSTLNGGLFLGNSAPLGGGMAASGPNNSIHSLTNVRFQSNGDPDLGLTRSDSGGGLHVFGPVRVTISDGTFSFNQAQFGGGARVGASSLTITDTTFDRNQAVKVSLSGTGGGLAHSCVTESDDEDACDDTLSIVDSTFIDNESDEWGGGAFLNDGGAILRTTFSSNDASRFGGGLHLHGGHISLTDSTFSDNQVGTLSGVLGAAGGGMNLNSPDSTLVDGCVFDGNKALSGTNSGIGGGFRVLNPDAGASHLVIETTIADNVATEVGGGASIHTFSAANVGQFVIEKSLFRDNTAPSGAGLEVDNQTVSAQIAANIEVINSTFSGNMASTHGGGAFVTSGTNGGSPRTRFAHTTFSDNTADIGGGVYVEDGQIASVDFLGSLLAGNSASNGVDCFTQVAGALQSIGANVIRDACDTVSGLLCTTAVAEDEIGGDGVVCASPIASSEPMALDPNGVHPLQASNTANSQTATCQLSDDQVGTSRLLGGACDAGAAERP